MNNSRPTRPVPEDRMQAYRNEREALAARLHQEHAPGVPKEVAEKIFAKAWEDGHASGEHEVAQQYEEIAQIVQAAVDEICGL